ncbi:ubiquitin domain-containing protein 1-like isoform X2 [Juglans microcarpa x Juglans regia]|uniref:ubiquitin domain-containing protein 1-like isoform X2 n=1 Tax=Juglans microcarpa x Juglans regia TaxID=2249226 RepID=UPI001B7EB0E5|nr:ubiquitin domain-containing protein 1-like isoform X2 [Juglans microcarpa x Juglans regia]
MGCTGSSRAKGDENAQKIRKPKPWKHSEPITRTQLVQMRDEFWDTAPHYGGQKGFQEGPTLQSIPNASGSKCSWWTFSNVLGRNLSSWTRMVQKLSH